MYSNKLERSETKALLRHATAQSSTKEVAALIKVPDARVSEGKQGKWHLPRESAEKLYEAFGRPLAAAGTYLKCEVWESFEESKKEADSVSRWRQLQRISEFLYHSDFINALEVIFKTEGCAPITLPETVVERVVQLIQDKDFCSWYRNNKISLSAGKEGESNGEQTSPGKFLPFFLPAVSSDNGVGFQEILSRHGLTPTLQWRSSSFSEPELVFCLLAELAIQHEEICETDELCASSLNPLMDTLPDISVASDGRPKEVVITGDVIWEKSKWLPDEKLMSSILPFTGLPDMIGRLKIMDYKYQLLYGVLPDRFNHLNMRLVITKSLDYHLLLTLSQQRAPDLTVHMRENELISADISSMDFVEWIPPRIMVIRDVKSENLFQVINEINAWLEIPSFHLDDLKREIAQNGGYVHGALYLE